MLTRLTDDGLLIPRGLLRLPLHFTYVLQCHIDLHVLEVQSHTGIKEQTFPDFVETPGSGLVGIFQLLYRRVDSDLLGIEPAHLG